MAGAVSLRPRPLDRQLLLRALQLAATVVIMASAGLALSRITGGSGGLWLANGIAVAILLRRPADERALLLAVSIFGLFGATLIAGDSLLTASLFALISALEIATTVLLAARNFAPGTAFEGAAVGRFLVAALVAPLAPAALAALWFVLGGGLPLFRSLVSWYGSDTLGLVIVAPLLLSFTMRKEAIRHRRPAETICIPLLAATLTATIFHQGGKPLLFLLAPIVLLAAFRLRPFTAMVTVALVSTIAAVLTARGSGPIATASLDSVWQTDLFECFTATMVVLVLPVIAVIGERDRLGLASRHSERLFHRIAEATPAGILYLDLTGRVTFANQRWSDLVGLVPPGFADNDWLDLVHRDDREAAHALWQRAQASLKPAVDDVRFLAADADSKWFEFSIYPDLIADRVVGFALKLFDISERHDAEAALHESEARYRLLAENSHDVILRIDPDGHARYVSNASRRLFGFDSADLEGRSLTRFIHPSDVASFAALFPTANGGRGEASAQFRHRCANGSWRWVEANARIVIDPNSGEPSEMVVSIRDIDARRHSELIAAEAAIKLRESHRLLTLAESLARVGHWRFDAIGGSFDCSPQVSIIADIPRTQAIEPADILALVHVADRIKLLRTLATARRGRAPADCGVRLVLDDEMRHVCLVVQAEHDERGKLVGLFGVMHDVTEGEIIQAELIRARDEAREAARVKSDFLATMSHEIRTPMTGVLGMIDLLRSDCSAADREHYMITLKQSANLLMAILDDILDFSRIEAGKIAFDESDFDLEELLQSTLDLFDGAASQKGLLLSLDHDRSGPSIVRGDSVRLQQIVSNLLSNAIKFTAVGRVKVLLSAQPAQLGSQRWRIEVRDTGVGIPAEKLESLFEPFVQAEASTSRRFGGTGLGLAISRRLVEAMGGDIGVRSRAGRGSTFWLELTLPDGQATDGALASTAYVAATHALDVLVAEDNPVNQMIISAMLRRFGHGVTCVENGRQAVDLAALRRFDCILMDMQMPEMDGIAATRAIRASTGPCAAVPIIALTADASSERRRFYDGAGLTDFLTKPIDRTLLGQRLALLSAGEAHIGDVLAADPLPAAAAPFDFDRFNELRDILGATRIKDLLDLLVIELDRCPARIRELVPCGDLDGARAEAHGLKGAASNIGAVALGRIAAAIEGASNDPQFGEQLEALEDQARLTVKAIAALR
ncbi:MAG: PAS domain S-box protein [Sphingomicrobium sp.]